VLLRQMLQYCYGSKTHLRQQAAQGLEVQRNPALRPREQQPAARRLLGATWQLGVLHATAATVSISCAHAARLHGC
jgi:hypothetical protein